MRVAPIATAQIPPIERFLGGREGARQRAILVGSTLVGSVVRSRAVDDEAFSDVILSAVHEGICELPYNARRAKGIGPEAGVS
jgi:hypothetical protein